MFHCKLSRRNVVTMPAGTFITKLYSEKNICRLHKFVMCNRNVVHFLTCKSDDNHWDSANKLNCFTFYFFFNRCKLLPEKWIHIFNCWQPFMTINLYYDIITKCAVIQCCLTVASAETTPVLMHKNLSLLFRCFFFVNINFIRK